jgi:4-hydroxythreonine-4-phosphate dehydrogenase
MRVLITPGEPAGIGPDIVIKIAQQSFQAELVVIADPDLLTQRARQLNLSLKLHDYQEGAIAPRQPGTLSVLPIRLNAPVIAGKLSTANAEYVIKTLKTAATLCEQKKASAIVTGPVHKAIINEAGIHFTGHTEFFAHMSHIKQTVMLFVVDEFKVALLTTHLPLKDVASAITQQKIKDVLTILHAGLKQQFDIHDPRILVCGLNPHAGENGHLGSEEIDIISPALAKLSEQMTVIGPLPADSLFTPKNLQKADAILAMYHDQALPVVKYAGFDHAVNVTLGLPYIRTSVDHGTALDLAGSGLADAGSMTAAIRLAMQLAQLP